MKAFLLRSSVILLMTLLSITSHAEDLEYNLVMNARGHEITSLCIMRTEEDGSIIGTVANEFGVKSFDFTYRKGKAKVLNVIGPLNKWYIRRVLRGDMQLLLSNFLTKTNASKKGRTVSFLPNDNIRLENHRFNITYTLSPIAEQAE